MMEKFDLYTNLFNKDADNLLRVPEADYRKFEARMAQFNSECVINDAASWKAASEIVLTD